jgi:hypothetical protein
MSGIPEFGWLPMEDAPKDIEKPIVVRYRVRNHPAGEYQIQFARWSCDSYGEDWAWRPAHALGVGTAFAQDWMALGDFQRASENTVQSIAQPSFDL